MSWNPFRRHRPTGRHTRPVYPSVPGAAATLVAVAAEAAGGRPPSAQADACPAQAPVAPPPAPLPAAPAAMPVAAAPVAKPVAMPVAMPVAVPVLAAVPASGAPAPASVGAVGLGFADGQAVELAADDPRAESLRALAAALLEPGAR